MDWGSESTIVDCKNVCPPEEKPDMINHPRHYCREGAIECIDEIELIFGPEVTMHFCLGNVFKYRYRAGLKNNGYEDLEKSDWYMRKYKELKEKVEKNHQGALTINGNKLIAQYPYNPYNIDVVPCNTK